MKQAFSIAAKRYGKGVGMRKENLSHAIAGTSTPLSSSTGTNSRFRLNRLSALVLAAAMARELSGWAPGLRVSSRGYMLGYHDLKDPSVSGFFRFLARVGDNRMRMQIVRLEFGEQ